MRARAGLRAGEEDRRVDATATDSGDVSKAKNPWSRATSMRRRRGSIGIPSSRGRAGQTGGRSSSGIRTRSPGWPLVKSEPLQSWKDYLTGTGHRPPARRFLPKAFATSPSPSTKRHQGGGRPAAPLEAALDVTNEALPQTVGKVYSAKYFPPGDQACGGVSWWPTCGAFQSAHRRLSWMAPATRAKAKDKLTTLKVSVGYPNAWARRSGAGGGARRRPG